MSEDIITKEVSEETKPIEKVETESNYSKEETDAYIKKLRSENEKLRKESEKKIEQEKEAKQKLLEEQGKYKELYEQTLKEAEATKSKVDSIKKENALKLALIKEEAKHPELLENLFKKDGQYNFELDESGNISDWENVLNPIKTKYEDSFGKPIVKGFEPQKGKEKTSLFTKEQIMNMSDSELVENHAEIQEFLKTQ